MADYDPAKEASNLAKHGVSLARWIALEVLAIVSPRKGNETPCPGKLSNPAIDDDNPEWTTADFAAATKFPGGVRLKDLKPDELERILERVLINPVL